jgi:hypothetical protein
MIELNIDDIRDQNKTYGTVHLWINQNFGKADRCENKLCKNKSKKYHWAKLKDKVYEFKRENFIMLCASCHYYYDERFKNKIVNKRI